jgi:NADH-quinone oxidoreductase subunit G
VSDIDGADLILVVGTDPLHSSPILDLRIRKAIRRNGARLAVATERPTPLDGGAEAIARYAPGEGAHFVGELARAVGGAENVATPLAKSLREAGKVVVIWGERLARDGNGAEALLDLTAALGTASSDGSGLLEIPDFANARGLREAGCLPDAGPGLGATNDAFSVSGPENASLVGKPTEEIRAALESGELNGLILFGVDPLRDFPDTKAWEAAITAADFVVCFSMHENATSAKADVLFPLETHAEKDGTVTHPDGRLQRVRPSAGRPGDILPNIQVLAALSTALGEDTGINSQPTAFAALTSAVPFYASISDTDIGGRGIRWQDTPSSANLPEVGEGTGAPSERFAPLAQPESRTAATEPARQASEEGAAAPSLALGTYRDLWAGPITELNPPLKFLTPQQRLEISPADAERLDLKSGDKVRAGQNGSGVEATVQIRERVAPGTVFLAEGVSVGNANALLNGGPVRVEITKLSETPA